MGLDSPGLIRTHCSEKNSAYLFIATIYFYYKIVSLKYAEFISFVFQTERIYILLQETSLHPSYHVKSRISIIKLSFNIIAGKCSSICNRSYLLTRPSDPCNIPSTYLP